MSAKPIKTVWVRCINQSLREAGWAPLLIFAIHVPAAMAFDAYTQLPKFDFLMHFIGGVTMAFLVHRTSINASSMGILGPYHSFTHRLLVFTVTCAIAVFWEFAEFVSDRTLGTQSQAGLDDTLGDLLFGNVGAGVFIFFDAVLERYPQLSWRGAVQRLQDIKDAQPGD